MNFALADLFRIKDHYTPEEIAFNKLDVMIKNNVQTINQDINRIAAILNKYGIGRKDIQEFVFQKIDYTPQIKTNHEK